MKLTVSSIMSPAARRITCSTPLDEALKLMERHHVRHLPVVDGDQVHGMLTAEIAKLAQSLRMEDGAPPAAGDVCTREVLVVGPGLPVSELAQEMGKTKHDCALVSDGGKDFLGIVTATDLCRTLHLVLSDKGDQRR